jgi:hypothetical protein
MGPKVDPSLENLIRVRWTGLAKTMDSDPSLVVEGCLHALQPCDLEFVEMGVGLPRKVERDLVIKREQFVRVSQ